MFVFLVFFLLFFHKWILGIVSLFVWIATKILADFLAMTKNRRYDCPKPNPFEKWILAHRLYDNVKHFIWAFISYVDTMLFYNGAFVIAIFKCL